MELFEQPLEYAFYAQFSNENPIEIIVNPAKRLVNVYNFINVYMKNSTKLQTSFFRIQS